MALEADEIGRLPEVDDVASIILYDTSKPQYPTKVIAETRAWNWALAARQQWLDNERVIFNDWQSGELISCVLDLGSGQKRHLPMAIHSVSSDGMWALAPNFGRLRRLYSTYGYADGDSPSFVDPAPKDDGLYLLDVVSGDYKLVLSIAEIVESVRPTVRNRDFWVTHPTFNPSGSRFCFFLRYMTEEGFLYSKFLVAERNTMSFRLIAEEYVSHFDWHDDDRLLVWMRNVPFISAIREQSWLGSPLPRALISAARTVRRKFFPEARLSGRLHMLNVHTGQNTLFAPDTITLDGHQMFSPNREWLITDTYADGHGYRKLLLLNISSEVSVELASLHSPPEFGVGEIRCDLHPRWSPNGSEVCFDSTHEGSRQVYVASLGGILPSKLR